MPRNRQIFKGRTIREWSGGELSFKKPRIDLERLIAARLNKGMISSIDSVDIPIEALQLAKNAKVVFDKTGRRDGLTIFTPAAPNIDAVLKMSSLKEPDGSGHTYRFTNTSIHDLQAGAWVPITETVALAGTVRDRFNVAVLFNIFVFTNNGANNVQWIDPSTDTSDDLIDNLSVDLSNSEFRYCTGFFNRAVFAALRGSNEVLLAWSGEYGSQNTTKKGLEDLDPLVNETSGFSPLIDSPKDKGDFITGIFGMSSVLTILREESIWLATKQSSATNPFNAYPVIPGVGCDTPFSAQITKYGLAFFDKRTRTVYHFSPGSAPEPIGQPIERSIIKNIDDPSTVFGIYDPRDDAYSVCIPSAGSNVVQTFTYYFKTQAWVYNEYFDLSSFDEVELLTGSLSIDDLVGTIDDLVGDIDDLSPVVESEKIRLYGFTNGDLAIPDPNVGTDMGVAYTTDLVSKTFELPSVDTYVAMIIVEYMSSIPGTLEIWYAPDGGVDPDSSFILGDTFNVTVVNKPQIITFRKVVHSRRFAFAIRSSDGQFEILKYEVWVTPSGEVSAPRQVS